MSGIVLWLIMLVITAVVSVVCLKVLKLNEDWTATVTGLVLVAFVMVGVLQGMGGTWPLFK